MNTKRQDIEGDVISNQKKDVMRRLYQHKKEVPPSSHTSIAANEELKESPVKPDSPQFSYIQTENPHVGYPYQADLISQTVQNPM